MMPKPLKFNQPKRGKRATRSRFGAGPLTITDHLAIRSTLRRKSTAKVTLPKIGKNDEQA
jgi:hypothetical protein